MRLASNTILINVKVIIYRTAPAQPGIAADRFAREIGAF
jgi:hypothetical protein